MFGLLAVGGSFSVYWTTVSVVAHRDVTLAR